MFLFSHLFSFSMIDLHNIIKDKAKTIYYSVYPEIMDTIGHPSSPNNRLTLCTKWYGTLSTRQLLRQKTCLFALRHIYQRDFVMYETTGSSWRRQGCTCVWRTLVWSCSVIGAFPLEAGEAVDPSGWLGGTPGCQNERVYLSLPAVGIYSFSFLFPSWAVCHVPAEYLWLRLMYPALFVDPADQTLRPWLHVRLKWGVTSRPRTLGTPLPCNPPPPRLYAFQRGPILSFLTTQHPQQRGTVSIGR